METGAATSTISRPAPIPVKIVVAGGFGVGKTTLVGAISEIAPLTTEAAMTSVAAGIDDNSWAPGKTTTTVAMDFGRITIDASLVLYLFGTPGQDRFGFMWNDIAHGALGGVVLVDPRRLEECFPALDYFEKINLPFVVGVNCFEGAESMALDEVTDALSIDPAIPVIYTDARYRESVKDVLLGLLNVVLSRAMGG